jgi:hypothetical protein
MGISLKVEKNWSLARRCARFGICASGLTTLVVECRKRKKPVYDGLSFYDSGQVAGIRIR